jgi:excisionase family DNA binding protein
MDILGISRGTVGNMIRRGDLESKKIGARTLIPAASIRAVMSADA